MTSEKDDAEDLLPSAKMGALAFVSEAMIRASQ